jgi:glycine/sarcosine N-methyltransferase
VLRERLGESGTFDVLDCSCGIGTQSIGLALHGHRVLGTDLSPASLARAEREAESFGVSLETKVADMRKLDSEVGGTYDAVLSGNTLSHFDRVGLAEVFGAARAVLRPGGAFLATLRDYDALLTERPRFQAGQVHDTDAGKRIVFQIWDWTDGDSSYVLNYFMLREDEDGEFAVTCERTLLHAHSRDELAAALAQAGFEDVRWHVLEREERPALSVLAGTRR